MSMLEIYQEKLFDLLSDSSSGSNNSNNITNNNNSNNSLRIRELGDGSIFVQGLTESLITTQAEFATLLQTGLKRRVTASHAMNAESSRSHLCVTIYLKQQQTVTNSNGGNASKGKVSSKLSSKMHLIDLAGSELVRKTGAEGTRLQEAKYINKSLSALGNVIYALTSNAAAAVATGGSTSPSLAAMTGALSQKAENAITQQHIPYR